MLQRALQNAEPSKLHVAIIMDGNGRWAEARGLPRTAGHRAGVETVKRIVEAAPACGVRTLTLFAFSSDNWRRPRREVWSLMRLMHHYLRSETEECVKRGIRVEVVGRRDRLSPPLCARIEETERRTAGGSALRLRLAVDYSARDAILSAAEALLRVEGTISRETFARLLGSAGRASEDSSRASPAPDVDLLIRTGGEQRLSDFLLWESAYAELYFTRRMWPDFKAADLETAVREFYGRERRFGCVLKAVGAKGKTLGVAGGMKSL
jgi:undecaprenyl diphosphate synthase